MPLRQLRRPVEDRLRLHQESAARAEAARVRDGYRERGGRGAGHCASRISKRRPKRSQKIRARIREGCIFVIAKFLSLCLFQIKLTDYFDSRACHSVVNDLPAVWPTPLLWIMAKAIGEIVVKADHTRPPGAQRRVLVARTENILRSADARPLEDGEDDIINISRHTSSQKRLLSERSLKRATCFCEGKGGFMVSGCILQGSAELSFPGSPEIFPVAGIETPDEIRGNQSPDRRMQHGVRPEVYQTGRSAADFRSKQRRPIREAVLQMTGNRPAIVNNTVTVLQDRHKLLSAQGPNALHIRETCPSDLRVQAFVGERVAYAPGKRADTTSLQPNPLMKY